MSILEDLTTLSPRKLERRLDQLAKDALPCIEIWAAEANRHDGLTTGLHVDARARRDVEDLARVISEEPRSLITVAWSLARPARRSTAQRLLLRVNVQRPVDCDFVIRFDVTSHSADPVRGRLPLLLAASWFLMITDDHAAPGVPELAVPAPPDRHCLLELISERP